MDTTPALQSCVDLLVKLASHNSPESLSELNSDDHRIKALATPVSYVDVVDFPTSSDVYPKPQLSPKLVTGSAPLSTAIDLGHHLHIDDHSYCVVSAIRVIPVLLLDYLKVIINIPEVTMDAISSMVYCLKTFDSRIYDSVLAAGAIRSARLKNITVKHLGKSVSFRNLNLF